VEKPGALVFLFLCSKNLDQAVAHFGKVPAELCCVHGHRCSLLLVSVEKVKHLRAASVHLASFYASPTSVAHLGWA
jgi:hypothetical protein